MVDIIIAVFVGFLCFQGYRKGFVRTLFDTLGIVVSFFISKEIYYIVEDFLLSNTKLFVKIHDFFELRLSENIVSSVSTNIPLELQNFASNIIANETHTFAAFVDNLSLLTIRTISYAITFLVIYALILLLSSLIDIIMKLPLLNLTNRVLGGLTGILKSVAILYLIFALITPVLSFMQDSSLTRSILDSESSAIFYENNILLNYFSYKGFYNN
ncbi:MAG: CvpA family protein [Tissierellia bacterium]|nr:CvpA family protein [Tissierellia bacterium]